MIGYVTEVKSSEIVLDVHGVGYAVHVANVNRYQVDLHHSIKVYVYQVVTDSFQLLYGFKDSTSKLIFEKLIGVSGIGPKNAIAILSGGDPQALLTAIREADVTYLTNFPGVGAKTAKQIILDLKDKLKHLALSNGSPQSATVNNSLGPKLPANLKEALEALEALGYQRRDVKAIANQLAQRKHLTTNQYLSFGLKLLNRFSY